MDIIMLFLHTLFTFTLYRAPVDTSPVTEGVTLFKHRLLLLLLSHSMLQPCSRLLQNVIRKKGEMQLTELLNTIMYSIEK